MLQREGDHLKHTFQDDMEALFYVVLYCGLMYLPHGLPKEELAIFLARFFDERQSVGPGVVEGGVGKVANVMYRKYTGSVGFGSVHLREWVNTVADFLSSFDHASGGYSETWSNPEHLDAYWVKFLERDLERNDRDPHRVSPSPSPTQSAETRLTVSSDRSPVSHDEDRALGKHPSVHSDTGTDVRETKRYRSACPAIDTAPMAASVPDSASVPVQPRRYSERLLEKKRKEEREAEEKRKEEQAAGKRSGKKAKSSPSRARTTSETAKTAKRRFTVGRRRATTLTS